MKEKTERNIQIYLDKYGFLTLEDARRGVSGKQAMSYRQLSTKYNLSVTFLQRKVKQMTARYKLPKNNE